MYSLLISANSETFATNTVEWDLSRYLEHTPPDLVAQFLMSNEAKARLQAMPLVLAYEEGCGPVARVVWIKTLQWSASTIRFTFENDGAIPPIELEAFYEASSHLGITNWESTRSHWAVKDVDLGQALEFAGLIDNDQKTVLDYHPSKRLPWPPTTPAQPTVLPPASVVPTPTPAAPPNGPSIHAAFGITPADYTGVAGVAGVAAPGTQDRLAAGIEAGLHPSPIRPSAAFTPAAQPRVFIVHGRDNELKWQVSSFLQQLGLRPVILHEEANGGKSLLVKFATNAEKVDFAVVLMTPDDVGSLVDAPVEARARQNVVLELGYFIGKFGSEKICVLVKGNIAMPSDFLGVSYVEANDDSWKLKLGVELQEAGIEFDTNKLLRP